MNNWPIPEQIESSLANNTGAGVKIAILDSGVETGHPGLQGIQLEDDWTFEDEGGRIGVVAGSGVDVYGHGTAIASIIRQYAPDAVIGSFRVLNANLGSRNYVIRAGAELAMEKGYNLLNCSFGCRDDLGKHAMVYKTWLDQAYLKRVHVVTACNNENVNRQEWPGSFPTTINVNMAATRDLSIRYRRDHLVEFAARGVELTLPWLNGTQKNVTGSSFAAPLVAAYLARLLQSFPDLSVTHAKAILQGAAKEWSASIAHSNVPQPSQPQLNRL